MVSSVLKYYDMHDLQGQPFEWELQTIKQAGFSLPAIFVYEMLSQQTANNNLGYPLNG